MRIADIILNETIELGDSFDIELGETVIHTGVVDILQDGVLLEADIKTLALLKMAGATFESSVQIVVEGAMKEVNMLFKDIVNGTVDIYQIMNYPEDKIESYVSDRLKDMYDDIVIDYGLHADDDFEQIIDIIHKQLSDEYDQDNLMEAEYQGRKVQLGKPMAGDVKKSKVYVKGPKGNVVKVNFGDKNMKIKKSNPKRRKSFRARHNCDNPGPRWKARYWSCRAW
jgi:hypothetical protein